MTLAFGCLLAAKLVYVFIVSLSLLVWDKMTKNTKGRNVLEKGAKGAKKGAMLKHCALP